MAPEVFRHEPYNSRVDVYSFSMIVYQLFEFTPPFGGADPVEAARAAAMYERRPEFVSLMRPEPVKKASGGRWKGAERQSRRGLGALEGPWTGAAWLSPACTPPLVSGTRAPPSSSPPPGGLVACLHAPS